MSFEKLHKNTEKNMKSFRLMGFFIFFNIAETGLWQRQTEKERETFYFCFEKIERKLDKIIVSYILVIGKYIIFISKEKQ